MSTMIKVPNIGAYASFTLMAGLSESHTIVNYVEVVQLLQAPSFIPSNLTPAEGLIQVRQACAEAVGMEARVLRQIGAVQLLYSVWLEGMESAKALTFDADSLLSRVRTSYKEQLRRMRTVPTKRSAALETSSKRPSQMAE